VPQGRAAESSAALALPEVGDYQAFCDASNEPPRRGSNKVRASRARPAAGSPRAGGDEFAMTPSPRGHRTGVPWGPSPDAARAVVRSGVAAYPRGLSRQITTCSPR
jgi:hypothetical protein